MKYPLTSAVTLLVLASHVVHFSQSTCFTSISDVILQGHVIFSYSTADLNDCWQTCRNDGRCQSLNFFLKRHLCEVNNRTIEHVPKDALGVPDTAYFDNPYRVAVGTVKEMPAVSCAEILKTVGSVSGRYWLVDHARVSLPFMAYCNMTTLAVEDCDVGQCKNGGNCTYFGLGRYQCACRREFSGRGCETLCKSTRALGMESRAILDSQITTSSNYNSGHGGHNARLNYDKGSGGWVALRSDTVGAWIQVDMGKITVITGVATQGRCFDKHWVSSYSVKYSQDGSSFEDYDVGRVLNGNNDRFTVVRNDFNPPITTRYIRLVVNTWFGEVSIRMEIYGCAL